MSSEVINFRLRSDFHIKVGSGLALQQFVSAQGINNPLFTFDRNLEKTPYFEKVTGLLDSEYPKSNFKSLTVAGEPTYGYLKEVLSSIDLSQFDGIVSIGGGSVMDTGKALALIANNPRDPLTLKGFPLGLKQPISHITVPTILGSGSEASYNAVFIDEAEGRKLGINYIDNFPKAVLVDPELSMSAPTASVLSSALDCMVHAVDSFGSVKGNPISKMFAREAFCKAWSFVRDGDFVNPEKRVELALASILGIYALMNASDGPTNGFAYYFGVKHRIPHGFAGAMFLSDVMEWNESNGYAGYEELMQLSATDFQSFLEQYRQILRTNTTPNLASLGYTPKDVIPLSRLVSSALEGSFGGNPVTFSQNSAKEVIQCHLSRSL